MNFSQFEYFLALADTGSVKLAAERLFVSQAAISKQITNFESELGLTLFYRKYGSISLTPQGEILLDAVKRANSIFNEGLLEAIATSSSRAASFHVGVPEHATLGNLNDIFAAFTKENPDIFFYWDYCPIAHLSLDNKTSNYDAIIVHEQMLRNHINIKTMPIIKTQHIGLISSEHHLAKKKTLSFCDLSKERFYVPAPSDEALSVEFCKYICLINNFTPRDIISLPNVESVLKAVEIGLGVAVLDDTLPYMQWKSFRALPTGVDSEICMAWHVENDNPYIERLARKIRKNFVQINP